MHMPTWQWQCSFTIWLIGLKQKTEVDTELTALHE
ncbi:hypothetical protein Patl1_03913 [Pistacia atlantica]|uniref:Uncharacterized protein n=1 Tax=Pistacia atlantica TaxID=434234 RepID=A0ACC1BWX7_9ROSI|nr:hypothetical protein Patl1_03913 [Pistacia atlantica]